MTHPHAQPVRHGFSFIEILFAVMVLGIGFIMIAAIFPVAIRQAQGTVEDTAAGRVRLNAQQVLKTLDLSVSLYSSSIPNPSTFPTNVYTPITPGLTRTRPGAYIAARDPRLANTAFWDQIKGSLIDSADPRMAFIPLFRRDEVIVNGVRQYNVPALTSVFVTTARNTTTYGPSDLFRFKSDGTGIDDANSNPNWATLQPKLIRVYLTDGGAGGADLLEVAPCGTIARLDLSAAPTTVAVPDFTEAVVEGGLVVISDDRVVANVTGAPFSTASPYTPGTANGRYYRVGARRTDLDGTTTAGTKAYELSGGEDLQSNKENLPPGTTTNAAIAFIVGRGWNNVTTPTAFEGRAQDLHVLQAN